MTTYHESIPLSVAFTHKAPMPPLATAKPARPRLSWKKVGGLRFIRVGRLSLSFCLAK